MPLIKGCAAPLRDWLTAQPRAQSRAHWRGLSRELLFWDQQILDMRASDRWHKDCDNGCHSLRFGFCCHYWQTIDGSVSQAFSLSARMSALLPTDRLIERCSDVLMYWCIEVAMHWWSSGLMSRQNVCNRYFHRILCNIHILWHKVLNKRHYSNLWLTVIEHYCYPTIRQSESV